MPTTTITATTTKSQNWQQQQQTVACVLNASNCMHTHTNTKVRLCIETAYWEWEFLCDTWTVNELWCVAFRSTRTFVSFLFLFSFINRALTLTGTWQLWWWILRMLWCDYTKLRRRAKSNKKIVSVPRDIREYQGKQFAFFGRSQLHKFYWRTLK